MIDCEIFLSLSYAAFSSACSVVEVFIEYFKNLKSLR